MNERQFTGIMFMFLVVTVLISINMLIGQHNYSEVMDGLRRQAQDCPANTVENADIGNPAEVENIDPNAPLFAGVCNEANNFECGAGLSCVEGKCVVETAAADKPEKVAAVEQTAKIVHNCVEKGKFLPAGTPCGDQTDDMCDSPDTCNGRGQCSRNVEPPETECRPAAGPCDTSEFCNGFGLCPPDGFLPIGTACGDPTDDMCDNPDTCDGSGLCQPNFEPTTVVCRAMAGPCDVTEFCAGDGTCPVDTFAKPNAKKRCTGTTPTQYQE